MPPALRLKPLPGGPTTNLGAAAHLGSLYVAGGYRYPPGAPHAAPTNEVWSYDTATQAWTARAPMPTARAALGVAALLLPQHSFPRSGQSTGARMHPSANGETALFAVGGFSRSITIPSKYTPLNAVEVYHVESDTWYRWAELPSPRSTLNVVPATVRGKPIVVAVGGNNATADLCFNGTSILQRDVLALDPSQAAAGWRAVATWSAPRGYTAAAAVGDTVTIVGGYNGTIDSVSVSQLNLTLAQWIECESSN